MTRPRAVRDVLELDGVAPLLRVSEAAEILRIHPNTVRLLIGRGDLSGVRLDRSGRGRLLIPRAALLHLLRSRLLPVAL